MSGPHRSGNPAPTAAALVIGDEILSGKVAEANVGPLARTLRPLGIALRRVVVVGDRVEEIAAELDALRRRFDWVFTSGGVGPTHDDVTVEGVAKAFGVSVVRNPDMERMLRDHYGDRLNEGHLRMALVPNGAVLEATAEIRWPTPRLDNTWLLPGIPEIFRTKLNVLRARLPRATPFISRAVYVQLEESDIKSWLDGVVERFADIAVGSYPRWAHTGYKTKVTFDGTDTARVERARDAFAALVPPEAVVPVDQTGETHGEPPSDPSSDPSSVAEG
jgi:molybdopterin-biosynthesis enzyme MoeA-like protein